MSVKRGELTELVKFDVNVFKKAGAIAKQLIVSDASKGKFQGKPSGPFSYSNKGAGVGWRKIKGKNVFREARARGVETSVASVRSLELLKELDTTTLLGKAQEFSTTLKSELLKGIIAGESSEIITERLQRTVTTLTTAQTRLVVNDSFARFSNSAKFKAFEDLPETRYQYVGPNDGKTREACANVLNNPQNAKGFTTAEINGLDGVGQADRGGFNCRHEWEVVL